MAILQRPHAVGLSLCRLIIVEEETRNVTLASTFHQLEFKAFPARADPFYAYTVLTDGLGDFTLDLVVSSCDTMDEIYLRSLHVKVTDPRAKHRVWWRVRSCEFPAPGDYEFGLQADGELITQNVLKVVHTGESDD